MRYKVIIVDDNPLITQMLSRAVDYEKYGCILAGTAANGQEGKELILRARPHIIFTDVQMPVMDGFSMIDACGEAAKSALVVILSGFDDFRYAQKGIERRVFSYILKPGRIAQIEETLQRAVNEISGHESMRRMLDAAARLKRGQALASLLLGEAADLRAAAREAGLARADCLTLLGLQTAAGGAPSAEEAYLLLENAPGGARSVAVRVERRLWVATAFEGHPGERGVRAQRQWLEDALTRLVDPSGQQACLCHSGALEGAHRLPQAYREACGQLDYQAFAALPRLPDEQPAVDFQSALSGVIEALNRRDAPAARAQLGPMLKALGPHSLWRLDRARQALCDALLLIAERTPARVAPSGAGEIADVRTIARAREIFLDAISSVEDAAGPEGDAPLLIVSVLDYVRAHYAEDITLSKVAERFYVSPNHLGKLFKNATGKTFTSYLNQTRIQRAKRLLLDPTIRINEIADEVGYSDYTYFYQVFKKYEGVSPVTYRNASYLEDK